MIGYWNCQTCSSKIEQDTYPCPFCIVAPENNSLAKRKSQENMIKCLNCTFYNSFQLKHCEICEAQLPAVVVPALHKQKTIICKSCKQENHQSNLECVFCNVELYEVEKKKCDICNQMVKTSLFIDHQTHCMLSLELIKQEEEEQVQSLKKIQNLKKANFEECLHCRNKFQTNKIKAHEQICPQKQLVALQIDQKTRMTKLQLQAITYMHKKSQNEHNAVKSALQGRVKKLGFTIQDLNNLQFYVENYAPIIIHMHVSKHMQFFIKDTHYRSQFETNKSSGSLSRPSRIQWEDRMFDKKYSAAQDSERVKYGVINFTNDPKGVASCVSYGNSYFLLKEHVRERCTFTDKDSSAADASIATFKYCFKILSKMNDAELKAAFDASKAKQVSSNCTATYKQIQIHGPIEFSKDIQRIYVNKNEVKGQKQFLDMVYEFSHKNKIDHDFF